MDEFQTEIADTANNVVDSVWISNMNSFTTLDTFLHEKTFVFIPVLLILIILVIKYFLGNKLSGSSFLEFFLEIPVDLGFLSISFVITYLFVKVSDTQFGILITLVCLFVAMIAALLRRFALIEFEKENSSVIIIGLIGLPNLLISTFFVAYIISLI